MFNSNPLGNSTFSASNPFLNTASPTMDEQLANSYAKLEALKRQYEQQQQPVQQQATVFTDISNELNGLSEDELQFITNSKEYQAINQKYQNEFSQFLISKFSNEYVKTGNTRTLEELLATIRHEKEKYKTKFASDINEIRDQNKTLLNKNNELADANEKLQKELEEIKTRLWKDD